MAYWKAGKELNKGKYIVKDILGSGGFGVTYKIIETKTDRIFCLKTLNIEAQSNPDFDQLQTKFINEAVALASCPHPNIVRVYPQLFQEDGLWCMVMEYIEGIDLARYIETNGKLNEGKAITIVRKIGKALTSVHEKGFIHRDIKPSNIILRSNDSEPVLIDFGLAREFIAEHSMSMTNSRTETYAPIEQYQRHGKFGDWTDVYALAATLYTLLTARPPLPAKYRSDTEYDLTRPIQCEPSISNFVNQAILKGMELQPGDRPQSVGEWLEMLEPSDFETQSESIAPLKDTQLPTIPISPGGESIPEPGIVTRTWSNESDYSSGERQKNNASNQESARISRRNWLKYLGLALVSMIFALIGKETIDNFSQSIDEGDIGLTGYEFDVLTVDDKGEEINREKGKAKYFTEELGNGVILDMVEIPGGTYMMGSPKDEIGQEENEKPQHEVKISSFYIAKFLITQAQWKAVSILPKIEKELNPIPALIRGDSSLMPIENVSWEDAVEFCQRLSKYTTREYRLPSEAEWEYAARAGTITPFHFGATITSNLVNYNTRDKIAGGEPIYGKETKGIFREQTTPVGSFPPNAFGLYDMHGNAWEWCADSYHGHYQGAPNDGSAWISNTTNLKIIRGGSWLRNPKDCRSGNRGWLEENFKNYDIGFRCVMVKSS